MEGGICLIVSRVPPHSQVERTGSVCSRVHGRTGMQIVSCLALSLVLSGVAAATAGAQAAAVFDFELMDTGLGGPARPPPGAGCFARLSDQLRDPLRESGRFSVLDITPIAGEARAHNLQACGGCDAVLARRIGAELAITGTVQKVSTLILNMSIYVRDASSGRTMAAMNADLRGNTDGPGHAPSIGWCAIACSLPATVRANEPLVACPGGLSGVIDVALPASMV